MLAHGRDDCVTVHVGIEGGIGVRVVYVTAQVRYDGRAAFESGREGIVIVQLALDDGKLRVGRQVVGYLGGAAGVCNNGVTAIEQLPDNAYACWTGAAEDEDLGWRHSE